MDEEVKGFNRYMSKVDFQPVTEFIFQNGQLTDYKKGEFFSRQNESCKMVRDGRLLSLLLYRQPWRK